VGHGTGAASREACDAERRDSDSRPAEMLRTAAVRRSSPSGRLVAALVKPDRVVQPADRDLKLRGGAGDEGVRIALGDLVLADT
jgi:hypothetical protein